MHIKALTRVTTQTTALVEIVAHSSTFKTSTVLVKLAIRPPAIKLASNLMTPIKAPAVDVVVAAIVAINNISSCHCHFHCPPQ